MAGVGTRNLDAVAAANVGPKGEVVAGENSRGVRSLEDVVEVVDLIESGHFFLSLLFALLLVVVAVLASASMVNDVFFFCAIFVFFFIGRGVNRSIESEEEDDEDESSESMLIGSFLDLAAASACIL